MLPITAGLGALSYLTSLLQSSTAASGSSQGGSPLGQLGQLFGDSEGDKRQGTSTAGSGGTTSPFNPGMMASLISLQGQNGDGTQAQGLFAKLDTNGDGAISKTEFESALGANGVDTSSADALFSKLDTNGDGTISQSELAAARHGHHHHHGGGGAVQNGLASLLNATGANGAQTQTTTNADGSSTTTITYADGSTVSMTTPASSSDSNGGSSQGNGGSSGQINLLERLIKQQAQYLTQSTSGVSTVA